MPVLRLRDHAMDETIPDLVAFQRRGHLLQEGVAAVDREGLGGGQAHVELCVGEASNAAHKIAASAARIKAPQHKSEQRQWARKAALLPKALALCSFTQNVR